MTTVDIVDFDEATEYEHSAMLDWLSLKINLIHLPEPVVRRIQALNSRIFKVSASTGDIEWESFAWESVKSDTHQICFKVATHFYIQGSPARLGLPNNAFGALDIQYCAKKMIGYASKFLGLSDLFADCSEFGSHPQGGDQIAG